MSEFPMGFDPEHGFDMAALGEALQQVGRLLSSGGGQSGPVDWDMAVDVARKSLASDPSVLDRERREIEEAARLAEMWLDATTTLPAGTIGSAAWSRAEWVVSTLPEWQRIIEPVAAQLQQAFAAAMPEGPVDPGDLSGLPPELAAMAGPMLGMARQIGSVMFSMQVGQGLAELAGSVVSSTDVGIPLTTDSRIALLPRNIAEFGEGLGIPADEVRIFIALREAAHQRLFARVPWLRVRLEGAVEEYARGVRIDPERINEAIGQLDPTRPEAISEALAGGLFEPEQSDEQRVALARLETLLALVEGWVDTVVAAAVEGRLPNADRLRESLRRRRAIGGPAEKTFANLVGLELRPRRLRDAAALWEAWSTRGLEWRDSRWEHPDLLPSQSDLDDVDGFVASTESDPELPPVD